MHVSILHQRVADDAPADERDVLDQVNAIGAALERTGHRVSTLACTLDLAQMQCALLRLNPDVVFNLVETLEAKGGLVHLVPAVIDTLGIPYTGANAYSLMISSNKLLAKAALANACLPTPALYGGPLSKGRFIVKSVWEHASIGIDASSVVTADRVVALSAQRAQRFGGRFFAEAYVHGRELNVAMLSGPSGPEILPIAEIAFADCTSDAPRIVSYDAKWCPESPDYAATPVVAALGDGPVLSHVSKLAVEAWNTLGVAGYARVDFRVDEAGQPTILEVNANPCLSPGAGFATALARAGIPFETAVDRILAAANTPCS